MSYPRIPYMFWAKTHEDKGYPTHIDLSNSGMPTYTKSLDELGLDGCDIPLTGVNSYGYLPLKEALAERHALHPDNVFLGQGTSMANFALLAGLLDPGDTLLIESPVYECLSYPPASLGAMVVSFERKGAERWLLPVDRIVNLAKEYHAKAVFLSNPHNPSGAFDSDETLINLADRLGDSCILIVDEVYREWLDGEYGNSVALQRPNIVTTTSLTKVWGLSGLRGGWALGQPELIRKAYYAYDHMGVINPIVTDWIIWQLFRHPKTLKNLRDNNVASIQTSREMVNAFLAGPARGIIDGVMPEGGGFATWTLKGMNGNEVVDALFKEKGVNLVSGHHFNRPSSFRISWTRGEEMVAEGLKRFGEWLDQSGQA